MEARALDIAEQALQAHRPEVACTACNAHRQLDRLDGIARVAADIGYESEAAFSRAFKRVTGMTPGRWRDGGGDSPELMPLQFNKPLVPGDA